MGVSAMNELQIKNITPEQLELKVVQERFRYRARDNHPDKVHRYDGETDAHFKKRLQMATQEMQKLNHNYDVLKTYIENRDSAMWRRLQRKIQKMHDNMCGSTFGDNRWVPKFISNGSM